MPSADTPGAQAVPCRGDDLQEFLQKSKREVVNFGTGHPAYAAGAPGVFVNVLFVIRDHQNPISNVEKKF